VTGTPDAGIGSVLRFAGRDELAIRSREGLHVKLGLAGTGRMGSAIGARLLRLGHTLTAWNRTPAKAAALVTAGARLVDTPARLAAAGEIVLTILTDAAAVDAVYLGADGLFAGDIQGKLFVEMSTVRPAVAEALAARARMKNAAVIDAPVGGSVGPATDGKLLAFVGGSAGDIARARPVLDQLCRHVEVVGPVGAGARVKLAANLMTQVFWQSLGEALTLCMPLGLAPARLMEIVGMMSGAPRVLEHRAADIAAGLGGADKQPVYFDVDSVRKDLRTMLDEASALGRALPLAERALTVFDAAARHGLGAKDCAMLPALWARREYGEAE
jgi:3-hydroxyisobutyrate dehydrogenase